MAQTPEDLRDALAEEARRLAAGFLKSDLGGAALSAETIRPEAPFLLSLEEGLSVSGRMDLAFRTADRVVVVDFKSDRRRRVGEYDGQLSAYRAACRALYPGLPVQTWLFWLRDARAEERIGEAGEEKLLIEAARKAAGSPGALRVRSLTSISPHGR